MIRALPHKSQTHDRGRVWFYLALVLGLAIRLAILTQTSTMAAQNIDEQAYRQLATNLLQGNGFANELGTLTSMRPPLYPAFLASLWWFRGEVDDLQTVRFAQIVLSLLTTLLVYRVGSLVFGMNVGRLGAALVWLYPSLAFFNFLILTETLFTFLFLLFLYGTVVLLRNPGRWSLALTCGAALGLAALTRSVLWPLPLVMCPLLVVLIQGTWRQRLIAPLLLLAGYLAVVTPWAVRNTRLQGVVTVVDTMGGLNLRMGNYEYTPDERMWDAVALQGEQNWSFQLSQEFPGHHFTEGEKDKWAQRKAVQYMLSHRGISIRRSAIKFADFWGLEREFIAHVQRGVINPPWWFGVAVALLIGVSFPLIACLGAIGVWMSFHQDRRAQLLLLLPVVFITAVHTIVYGHSRYHLPLMPIGALYAAEILLRFQSTRAAVNRYHVLGALATCAGLAFIWVREIVFTDADRLRALLEHVF